MRECPRMKSIAPILVLAVATVVPVAAQDAAADKAVVEGKCNYSSRLAPLRDQGHIFIECDRLEMERRDGQVDVTFAFPARLYAFELRGRFGATGVYDVKAIRLRSWGDWREAEGKCEFEPAGNNYPAVACLLESGGRHYVVNFGPEG